MPNDLLFPSPVSHLYVHVPFCAHKCEYCAFFSETPSGDLVNRYVNALVKEFELTAENMAPRTIYFGGGTPSLLNLRQWEQILVSMERLHLREATEWTVECNPATISLDKARLLREHGVNRISLGIQSLNEDLLTRLGRIHNRAMVFKSVDLLRQAGFDNLNLDLMFAIPGQTMEIWRQTLVEALAMGSEHLSCYEVIYEEDTPLFEQLQAGQFAVDENLACDMYDALLDTAGQAGFRQYEIANFGRDQSTELSDVPSRACQHNVNYWRGGSFYGLGPSATGYVGGVRTRNWANTTLYCEQLERNRRAFEYREQLVPLARAGETAAFGLRMTPGWPFLQFQQVTGFDLRNEWAAEMKQMEQLDFGRRDENRFQLTRNGLRFADWVAEQFIRL
jgi:oxygen-independent coproporphyrinogen-3 oxidase